MRYAIVFVVALFVIFSFLFSGTAIFAAQATTGLKKPVEQCVKGGKALPTVKSKNTCIKKGGAWVKMEAPQEPPDPLGKSKAMPIDPLEKSKKMPPDPLGKSKAMPPDPLGRSAQPQEGSTGR